LEKESLGTLEELGVGCIASSPLAQGLLTNKYLNEVPENSCANAEGSFQKDFLRRGKSQTRPGAQRNRKRARANIDANGDCVGAT
jgi:aryl-alcohol dehydrogenase-like predicted oxidoreductase